MLSCPPETLLDLCRPLAADVSNLPGNTLQCWPLVCALAVRHGVLALLGSTTQALGLHAPADVRDVWAGQREQQRALNEALVLELGAICQSAGQRSIHCVALKGSAALLELYADRGHRSLVDLDILVPHPQLPVLVEALTQEGYRSRAPATGAEAEAVGLRRGDDITLLRPGGQLVELHTTLGIPAAKPEEIWSRARTIASGGVPIGVLCPTHFLIHTAVHYLKHLDLNFAPLKGLIDIVLAVRKYGGELDWEDFWATATRWEVGDRVSLVMATLNHHWGLGVPGVPEGVEPLSAEVLVYGRPDVAERRAAHLPGVYLSRVQAAAELKGFRSRGRYLFRLLFPEPENMRHRYGVPEGRPLLGAYLRHPFTLAGRLAAGLGALAWRRARGLGKRR